MKGMFTMRNPAATSWLQCILVCLISLVLTSGCDSIANMGGDGMDGGDGSGGDDGTGDLIDAKIFDVDMQVMSWDTSSESSPQFSSVASMLFGTFPTDPLAVGYTVQYIDPENPALQATASWEARNIAGLRAPVPDTFAVSAGVVPGYVDGIVGDEYFIRVAGSGCQGGTAGNCRLGTESTNAMESLLRDIRATGTLRVTVEFE
jgi:hypothetical protein